MSMQKMFLMRNEALLGFLVEQGENENKSISTTY